MTHINPNAIAVVALGAVIGALAGSVLWGLAIGLIIVIAATVLDL